MDAIFPVREYLEWEKYCRILPECRDLWHKDWPRLLKSSRIRRPRKSGKPELHRKMLKAIHDLYARDETFLDFLAYDLDDGAVWFNNSEFARFHNVNGRKILSILTSDTRTQTLNIHVSEDQNPDGVTRSQGILFCRVQDIKGEITSGQRMKLDGRLYRVSEARMLQEQVWRIVLEANNA